MDCKMWIKHLEFYYGSSKKIQVAKLAQALLLGCLKLTDLGVQIRQN